MTKSIAIVVLIGAIVVSGINGRATSDGVTDTLDYCSNDEQCSRGQCCLMSGQRQTKPQCRSMPSNEESCRPGKLQINTTLSFRDGSEIVTIAHFAVCPCADGLSCDVTDGKCRASIQNIDSNHLSNDYSDQDD